MPNHMRNEIIAAAHVIDSLKGEPLDNNKNEVDFNTVIPMPAVLEGDCGMHIDDWAKLAMGHYPLSYFQQTHAHPGDSAANGDWGAAADALHVGNVLRLLAEGPFPKDFNEKDFAMFLQRIRALKETGFTSWYDWAVKHWGTKWNAYDVKRLNETTVRFDTAWSPPIPVIEALSRKFPKAKIRFTWADEDYGAKVGKIVVRNGGVIEGGSIENDSREAYAVVLDLHFNGVVPEEMEMTADGKLRFRDEEEVEA
jgi:hypothetical protein